MAQDFGFVAYDVDNCGDPFVFISYKSDDWERVAVYARYLHNHGVNVWYDNGLHAGSDWESYLMSVIEKPNCRAVLLFVSAAVAHSSVIPLETTHAREHKKPTVAVYLEGGLDLEVLLNKAIKVYVNQRQSVFAYNQSEKDACAEVLAATKEAMANVVKPVSGEVDKILANASVFRMNFQRKKSADDLRRAASFYQQAADEHPADYRGWLGLAECELLGDVRSLEDAVSRLSAAQGYYSYVVAAGCNEVASGKYIAAKSEYWEKLLDFAEEKAEDCDDLAEMTALVKHLTAASNMLGHTTKYVREHCKAVLAGAALRLSLMV